MEIRDDNYCGFARKGACWLDGGELRSWPICIKIASKNLVIIPSIKAERKSLLLVIPCAVESDRRQQTMHVTQPDDPDLATNTANKAGRMTH
jgi:hypothetical protein